MKYSKTKLIQSLQNVPRQGWTNQKLQDLVDSLWTEPATASDDEITISIDFADTELLEFVYTCPVAMQIVAQESQGAAATIDPPVNTLLNQFDKVTITAAGLGLVVLRAQPIITQSGGEITIPLYFSANTPALDYTCPDEMRIVSQKSQGAAAIIDPPINTLLAKFEKVRITATQPGLVLLTGQITDPQSAIDVIVAIDFVDATELQYVYTCPVGMQFTFQESEDGDATIDPPLSTLLNQFDSVTITAQRIGLIVLKGKTVSF
jgi:hypothetical protein